MKIMYNSKLLPYAKKLRKEMTKEERRLWYDFLQSYEKKIYRQKIIGQYIADFYCFEAKLVIEIDGSQHYEDSGMTKDKERTEYFQKLGIRVLRIPNNEVLQNFEGVCQSIDAEIKKPPL